MEDFRIAIGGHVNNIGNVGLIIGEIGDISADGSAGFAAERSLGLPPPFSPIFSVDR